MYIHIHLIYVHTHTFNIHTYIHTYIRIYIRSTTCLVGTFIGKGMKNTHSRTWIVSTLKGMQNTYRYSLSEVPTIQGGFNSTA